MLESSVVFSLVGALILAVVLILFISFKGKTTPALNRDKFQSSWLQIENSVNRGDLAACQLAIMNADKLLDTALKDRRIKGDTMGDRMKAAQPLWRNANNVWTAHKVRNRLAHEHGATVSYDITLQALSAYKQGLKDLGAI